MSNVWYSNAILVDKKLIIYRNYLEKDIYVILIIKKSKTSKTASVLN